MSNNIKRDDSCPCGSGLTYMECCLDTPNKWMKDETGGYLCSNNQLTLQKLRDLLINGRDTKKNPMGNEEKIIAQSDKEEDILNNIILLLYKKEMLSNCLVYILLTDRIFMVDDFIPGMSTGDRMSILDSLSEYANSEDKSKLLLPFKFRLNDEVYNLLKSNFENDHRLPDDILSPYFEKMVNDKVIKAMKKYSTIKENDPCPCGSKKKYKDCCK